MKMLLTKMKMNKSLLNEAFTMTGEKASITKMTALMKYKTKKDTA